MQRKISQKETRMDTNGVQNTFHVKIFYNDPSSSQSIPSRWQETGSYRTINWKMLPKHNRPSRSCIPDDVSRHFPGDQKHGIASWFSRPCPRIRDAILDNRRWTRNRDSSSSVTRTEAPATERMLLERNHARVETIFEIFGDDEFRRNRDDYWKWLFMCVIWIWFFYSKSMSEVLF